MHPSPLVRRPRPMGTVLALNASSIVSLIVPCLSLIAIRVQLPNVSHSSKRMSGQQEASQGAIGRLTFPGFMIPRGSTVRLIVFINSTVPSPNSARR